MHAQLKGISPQDERKYTFTAYLSAFQKDSNEFCKTVGAFVDQPSQFCDTLVEKTGGIITREDSPPNSQDAVSGRKRPSSSGSASGSKKSSKKLKQDDTGNEVMQQEILQHQIGSNDICVGLT